MNPGMHGGDGQDGNAGAGGSGGEFAPPNIGDVVFSCPPPIKLDSDLSEPSKETKQDKEIVQLRDDVYKLKTKIQAISEVVASKQSIIDSLKTDLEKTKKELEDNKVIIQGFKLWGQKTIQIWPVGSKVIIGNSSGFHATVQKVILEKSRITYELSYWQGTERRELILGDEEIRPPKDKELLDPFYARDMIENRKSNLDS